MSIARNRLLPTLKRVHFARINNVPRASYANRKTEITDNQKVGSYNAQIIHIPTQIAKTTSQRRDLMAVWPDVVQDITSVNQELNLPDVTDWLRRALEYNVPGGKNTRGLTLLYAYEMLMPTDRMTPENYYLARILAWCMELLQAFLLVLDDIEDRSWIRRKKPCWYRHEEVGLAAINDAVLIESVTYHLLRKYFKKRDCYIGILETCQEIMMKTLMGQCLEFTNFRNTLNLDRFTMDRYDGIAYYKTALYTYVLPVMVAMHFVGIRDEKLFRQAKAILMEIGHLYQVQDDYLSCYGVREILGKFGTDIEEGKCTWLAVTALQRATPVQRNILEECYGSNDPEKVKRVRQLYKDLDLPKIYFTYEQDMYDLINIDIQRIPRNLPRELFRKILNDLYCRQK